LRTFLREFIDRIFSESAKVPKKRTRISSDEFYDKERAAPFQAPKWTVSGYKGSLKNAILDAVKERYTPLLEKSPSSPSPQDPRQEESSSLQDPRQEESSSP
jgi:hypothetical protein